MKKLILAILLLLSFALVAVSCTPDNDLPLKTDENGNVVTNENGDPVTEGSKESNEENDRDIERGDLDDDGGGWSELTPAKKS